MFINDNKGLSLVEVMIALVVFLIVFMGLLQTSLLSIDHNLRNILRDEATTIAAGRMNELKNLAWDSPNLSAGTRCQTLRRNIRNIEIATGGKPFIVCDLICRDPSGSAITPCDADTRIIQVVVGWNHKNEVAAQAPTGREFQLSITTVRRR